MATDGVRDMRVPVGTITKVLLWIVYVWVMVNLVLLTLAFILQLLGANPEAGFTEWVYRSVQRAMAPFRGMFTPVELSDQSVLDTSLLFAMIIYGFVALLLRAGIDWTGALVERHRRKLQQEAAAADAERRQQHPSMGTAAPLASPPASAAGPPNVVVPANPGRTGFGPPTDR